MDNTIQDISNELQEVISWFITNKLHLSANKTTFIAFHINKKQCTQNKHIVIYYTNDYQSSTINFRGINIDETPTWLLNIHLMSTKIAKTIGIPRCLSKYVSTNISRSKGLHYCIKNMHISSVIIMNSNATKV